jgi:hypothetical protein
MGDAVTVKLDHTIHDRTLARFTVSATHWETEETVPRVKILI